MDRATAVRAQQPVTVLATRRVHPGREPEFDRFLQRLLAALTDFPGCLGATVLEPVGPSREYLLIYRYNSPASLRDWRASPQRRSLVAASSDLAEAPPEERALTGAETWFTAPHGGVVRPLARWKMWLLSTCAIYPTITAITMLAGPTLAHLAPPARFAIVVPMLSAAMTWVMMPALSRLFAKHLSS
jgi:antibiotic biosynthesis monooxygenase (ABM) superfamily enzyme